MLVHDEKTPRQSWKIGRIIETQTSADGEVRGVKVAVVNKKGRLYNLNRPVQRIYPLEIDSICDDSIALKIKKQVVKDKLQKVEQQTKDVLQEAPEEMQRAVKLSQEKGSSSWLSIIPLKEMGFTLNKKEFHDAVSLRYDWEIKDIPSKCVCGERFDVNHAMICMKGGFVVQRHNELRDLEAELLNLVCKDVETEPVLQDITGEVLSRGANTSQEARVDIHARGFLGEATICLL